jgi:hypothetical protein
MLLPPDKMMTHPFWQGNLFQVSQRDQSASIYLSLSNRLSLAVCLYYSIEIKMSRKTLDLHSILYNKRCRKGKHKRPIVPAY